MRIKKSLITFILLLSLIPMFFLWLFQTISISDMKMKNATKFISTSVSQKSSVITSVMKKVENNANELAKETVTIKFASANSQYPNETSDNPTINNYYDLFRRTAEITIKSNDNIKNIILLNNKGSLAFSATQFENGIAKRLGNDIKVKDGFSEFFMTEQAVNNFAAFAYVTELYDESKVYIGKLIFICDTSEIQTLLRTNNAYESTNISLIDFSGNMVEFPFTELINYRINIKYNYIRSKITLALDNNKSSVIKSFKAEGQRKIACIKPLPSINCAIVSVTNKNSIVSSNNINFNLFLLVIVFAVIIISTAIIFACRFSKPVLNIMHTLSKKQHGNNFVRFNIDVENEFGTIGKSFNDLLNDISESEERYRLINEMNNNIVFEYNFRKDYVSFSKNYNKMFGYRPKTDMYEDSFFTHAQLHPEDAQRYQDAIEHAFEKKSTAQGEFRFKTIYGSYVWFLIKAQMLYDNDERPYKIIGVMVDIDNAKLSEKALIQRAEYDSLTGLFNRETFEKRLANEFVISRVRKQVSSVIFIDIDDFKSYNDTYSHACGDEVLKFISDTIKELVRNCGFAGRYGGDEFIVCINSHDSKDETKKFAQSVIDVLKAGFDSQVINQHLNVNCSIGISFFSETGNNLETIIDEADEAMYKVKKHGKSNYSVFSAF